MADDLGDFIKTLDKTSKRDRLAKTLAANRERASAARERANAVLRDKVAKLSARNAETSLRNKEILMSKVGIMAGKNARIAEATRERAIAFIAANQAKQGELNERAREVAADRVQAEVLKREEIAEQATEKAIETFQQAQVGPVERYDSSQDTVLAPAVARQREVPVSLEKAYAETKTSTPRVFSVYSSKPAEQGPPAMREYGKPVPELAPISGSDLSPKIRSELSSMSVVPKAAVKATVGKLPTGVISVADARALALEAEAMFMLPAGTMVSMLAREAPVHRDAKGRVVGYVPSGTGGAGNSFLGLYQFDPKSLRAKGERYAWEVSRDVAKKYGVLIGDVSNWMDARANTMAAAAYAAMHRDMIVKAGKTATPDLIYYGHQQGTGKLGNALAGNGFDIVGKQSASSVKAIRALELAQK